MQHERIIPILQSSLPPFERMLPYLEQVESNRCHSNFGLLFRQFEHRMAEFLNIPENQIVMFCNGTLALMMGMMAFNVPHGKYCLLPSWTFSATPASAKMAGFDSQSLTPEIVRDFLKRSPVPRSEIGAVMAVSPFGSPISRLQWDLFTGETGIPVMIDAAASFDAVHRHREMNVGKSPIMVSACYKDIWYR